MGNFNGNLNPNEIYGAIYNMIISQKVFADNIANTGSSLLDKSRVDGTLYGDTKLYYATDVLYSEPWGNDGEMQNLLKPYRPEAPEVQEITLDVFRQISLTLDNYLSKRAWSNESAFAQFNSQMLGWLNDTKRVYESTIFNSFVGTAKSDSAKQNIEIQLPTDTDKEKEARLQAMTIAQEVANLFDDLKDISRDFNDYGNLRSYNPSDLVVVWNNKFINKIKKYDLPTIFHKEGLIDKFGEYTLNSRYFGTVNKTSGTTTSNNTTVRSLVEKTYGDTHVFAGDLLPNSTAYQANETYTEDPNIMFKVMHKSSVPFMSAFSTETSFFNSKALNTNHYLTFGHNTLEYLKNYPFITVKKK